MEQDPRVWIATLRASHEKLASLVAPLTPEQLRGPSYCSDWTVAQVLSHLGSGAEIGLMTLPGALGQAEPAGREAFGPIWDTWNAKSPDAQAADAISADEKHVEALEQLGDDELAAISFPFFGMTLDAVGLIRLRLGEHAMHTWDVAVSGDPDAAVAPGAVALLIDNVPGFLAPRLGRAPDRAFRIHIQTTDPDRDYLLIAADPVSMPDWPGDGGGADAKVTMPAEALLRLAYGRLDAEHTPAGVDGDAADLERLRQVFPGF
ncbi:MAG TPA: maleylpyruvate isomerase family mycothiol-dependent enzyme [Streptosporangiaceae bacterium]|nr:maleylpyruvate isomerase family mycothiol-dependent enzyme [Streptosporangiaceae bacterium]